MTTTTMAAEVKRFLDEREARTHLIRHEDDDYMSPATVSQYRFTLETVFLPFCADTGIKAPKQVTDDVLKQFDQWLKGRKKRDGKPLSPESRRTYWRATRTFLTWLEVDSEWRPATPKKGKSRDQMDDEMTVLTRQQIDQLEDHAATERDRLIVRVLADSGVRVGELLSLRQKDLIDKKHEHKYFLHVDGKTGARYVSIPSDVFKRLQVFADQGARRGDGKLDDEAPIFQSKRRRGSGNIEPLTRSGVLQLLKHLGSEASIPFAVHPHLFRSSYTTYQLKQNVNAVKVMRQLGHNSMTMILNHYERMSPNQMYDDLVDALRPSNPRRR